MTVHEPERLSWFISRRLVSRAAASSSSRSSSARRRSTTACLWVSSSAWPAAVLAGAPRPLRSNACWPSSSDSPPSRSLTCWASLRFCSCRLAFSASTDRWLIAVDAGDGSVVAAAGALSTAVCRSACRCTNERCTFALSATAEMVISDPWACMSAGAWWTRCRRRSTSRRRALASGVSVVTGWSSGLGGRADRGHAEADELAGLADHGDCVGDQGLVLLGKVLDVGLDAADQLPQLGDLFLARGELGFGPVLKVGGGLDPFPVGEQLLQVGLQLGQVGRVAAEMPAAQAGQLLVACPPPCLDVRRLGADPQRDRHLPDAPPGMLVGQQPADTEHDPAPLVVELGTADPVYRGPDTLFSDAAVAESCLDGVVTEQVPQHVRGNSLVGMPLCR